MGELVRCYTIVILVKLCALVGSNCKTRLSHLYVNKLQKQDKVLLSITSRFTPATN